MHEDGAAAVAHARDVVVTKHDDKIVEMILARETVALIARRQFDEPVIVWIVRIFAPAIEGPDRPRWQRGARARAAIRAIEHLAHGKAPNRRRAVPLAFRHRKPGPAKGRTANAVFNQQQPLLRASRRGPDRNGPRKPK